MVIDTSVFIEYLRAKNKQSTKLFLLPDNANYSISAITVFELLMGATTTGKANDIKLLTEGLYIIPFTNEVSIKASQIYHELRKTNTLVEFRDIFIAATCLANQLPIVTLNIKHFARINGLEII